MNIHNKLTEIQLINVINLINDDIMVKSITKLNNEGKLIEKTYSLDDTKDNYVVSVKLKIQYMSDLGLKRDECLNDSQHSILMSSIKVIESISCAVSVENVMEKVGMVVPRTEEEGLDMALKSAMNLEFAININKSYNLN